MAKYRVPLTGFITATVVVETDKTDPEGILEEAQNEGVPGICAQCSGWGRPFSLDVGDEWDPVEDENGKIQIYKLDD